MARALYIGGSSPGHVFSLLGDFDEIMVLASEQERRDYWFLPAAPAIRVVTADPFAINLDVQPDFDQGFDGVYLDSDSPALKERAALFLKPGGTLGTRRC